MTGALLQLVTIGKQDSYLIGNPQITYFKSVYKRHTNFALESIPIYSKTTPDFNKLVIFDIDRKGDLLYKLLLEVELSDLSDNISWINNIGNYLIDNIEFQIGDVTIDKHYGQFLDIIGEVKVDESHKNGYNEMIGKYETFLNTTQQENTKLFIPLWFWFSNDIGNSLPLIALQYHNIKLVVKTNKLNDCLFSGNNNLENEFNPKIDSMTLFADFIYLDNNERKKFAQEDHQYLIEQVQFTSCDISPNTKQINIDLTFNLPIKEMVWTLQRQDFLRINDYSNYSNSSYQEILDTNNYQEILHSALLTINGTDRFYERKAKYFRLVQPFNHHTSIPNNYFYFYSFSLKPEKIQPSGSINFSRIDNSTLKLKINENINTDTIITVNLYAINYNLLKISNGMGGLIFND